MSELVISPNRKAALAGTASEWYVVNLKSQDATRLAERAEASLGWFGSAGSSLVLSTAESALDVYAASGDDFRLQQRIDVRALAGSVKVAVPTDDGRRVLVIATDGSTDTIHVAADDQISPVTGAGSVSAILFPGKASAVIADNGWGRLLFVDVAKGAVSS